MPVSGNRPRPAPLWSAAVLRGTTMPLFSVISGSDAKAMFSALNKSQAVIEFDLQGNILTANENFC
ncbi:hypothetical protein, partial [Paraburkholderia sp. SIMBA_030]|uniref:hypothetical protein n=1 Tax=Paraburkholderia sp. SIMBA_030 TaxID=3085773 RepID=UPI00397DF5C1